MESVILVVHFTVAIFLVGTILLQTGKGTDLGAALGAGSSQTVFGPRGAATILHKITVGAAITFLVTSITLAYMARQDAGSVLESAPVVEHGEPGVIPEAEPIETAPEPEADKKD